MPAWAMAAGGTCYQMASIACLHVWVEDEATPAELCRDRLCRNGKLSIQAAATVLQKAAEILLLQGPSDEVCAWAAACYASGHTDKIVW